MSVSGKFGMRTSVFSEWVSSIKTALGHLCFLPPPLPFFSHHLLGKVWEDKTWDLCVLSLDTLSSELKQTYWIPTSHIIWITAVANLYFWLCSRIFYLLCNSFLLDFLPEPPFPSGLVANLLPLSFWINDFPWHVWLAHSRNKVFKLTVFMVYR